MRGDTIGVLSNQFGGVYFGQLLEGMTRVLRPRGTKIMAIQTLNAGVAAQDCLEPPKFRTRVGWDEVVGFAVILNAVDAEYLTAVRESGKPVVMISDTVAGFHCPTVLPDNAMGVRAAVAHLIGHGHRRIAFAGNPVQLDLRERYEAYRQALLDHGITPDPALFYDTGNNQVDGGERAGRAMMAAGMPSTAVVTGNDLNALGLARALQADGRRLPDDQAIVGFDDMEDAAFLSPSLSTVRQSFDVIGSRAVELLLRAVDGEDLPDEYYRVPTTFVARESCGCPSTLRISTVCADEVAAGPIRSVRDLAAGLAATLVPDGDLVAGERLSAAVDVVAGFVQAAAEGVSGPDFPAVQRAVGELYQIRPWPESVVSVMRWLRRFGEYVAEGVTDEAGRRRVDESVQELIVALANAQGAGQFADASRLRLMLFTHHNVGTALLRGDQDDPRSLAWLGQQPNIRGGCLALWADDQPRAEDRPYPERRQVSADRDLRIVGLFPDLGFGELPRSTTTVRFPPSELVALLDDAPDDMIFVAPMKVNDSDRGVLAVVGPIEARFAAGRENVNQWAAMLTIAIDRIELLESLHRQQELLRHAALFDSLTELPNRTYFLDCLERAISRARRYPQYRFAVLLLDLDGFKVVNDSLGHLAGDELLIQVASRVRGALRHDHVAARLGGDEFAILLDVITDDDSAIVVAERLRSVFVPPFQLAGQEEVVVGASIGIALSTDGYGSAKEIIRNADIAMYAAKARGKGTYVPFNATMLTRAVDRLHTEAGLRRAFENGEFEVHYQPIVDLDGGQVRWFEALLRWRHPVQGLLAPGSFLQVAEESGLILQVGRWLLDEACGRLRSWQSRYDAPDLQMSVNVSNRQFWHGGVIDDLAACLRSAGIKPECLTLEVSEGVIMHDLDLAYAMVARLREIGVGLHIDDFGSGRLPSSALRRLAVDAVKIDRALVASLGVDERGLELVNAAAATCVRLGLPIVAEGVETTEQRDHLRRLGCRYGQGYLFSRPVAAAAADALLAARARRGERKERPERWRW